MPHTRHAPHTRDRSTRSSRDASPGNPIDSSSLSAFIGEWHTEGRQLAGPVGAAAKVTATQKFEWLQGNIFLIHRFDGRVGDSPASCVEVIGCERDTGSCRVHTFYNNGLTNVWDVELHENTWEFVGDWNMNGECMKVRCRIAFDDDGKTMHSRWEYSKDAASWKMFWELTARRVAVN